MSSEEIAYYLRRKNPKHIVRGIMNPMLKENLLELTIPQSREHPYQKYRARG